MCDLNTFSKIESIPAFKDLPSASSYSQDMMMVEHFYYFDYKNTDSFGTGTARSEKDIEGTDADSSKLDVPESAHGDKATNSKPDTSCL